MTTTLTTAERTLLADLSVTQLATVEQILSNAHLDEYDGKRNGFYAELSAEAEAHYGGAA